MTSKLRRGIVAAVCALGATVATVTPAHAATANATYNCGVWGSSVLFTFIRTAPTPPTKNLTVKVILGGFAPVTYAPGQVIGTLKAPPSPPYPLVVTNPNAIPAGFYSLILLTGVSPATLTGPPASVTTTFNSPPQPPVSFTCTLSLPAPTGWPI